MSLFTDTISQNLYCNVATVTLDGMPWNTPLFYVYHQNKIYWWSPLKAQHSQNIIHRTEIFITIFNSQLTEGKGKGIYIRASAKALENNVQIRDAIKIYNARSTVFKLSMNNSSGKAPTRIFVAQLGEKWTNVDGEDRGYFIDTREPIDES